MADFEIWAPDDAAMIAAAQATTGAWDGTEVRTGRISAQGVLWALNYYGKKYVPTGKTVKNRLGHDAPEMAPVAGVFAIFRWDGDPTLIPPVPAGSGVTIAPLPADSPYRFA